MPIKTLFVYFNPHPSHEGFAKAINADFWHYNKFFNYSLIPKVIISSVNGFLLPNYPIYLTEGGAPISVLAIYKMLHRKCIHINLIGDETFMILGGVQKTKSTYKSSVTNFAHKFSSKYIDGAIAVSALAKETAEPYLDIPIKIVHPFIEDDLYRNLPKIQPKILNHTVLTIGYNRPNKGIDILIDSFQEIKKEVSDAQLYIIGRGYPDEWKRIEGVHIEGFVKDLIPYFMKSSLYVQPSIADTFPVTTLESLRAGLPTIVTENTGTKEVIQYLGNAFIRKVNAEDIAHGIMSYFDLQENVKYQLSEKAKILSEKFSRQNMCQLFHKEFTQLIKEIS